MGKYRYHLWVGLPQRMAVMIVCGHRVVECYFVARIRRGWIYNRSRFGSDCRQPRSWFGLGSCMYNYR